MGGREGQDWKKPETLNMLAGALPAQGGRPGPSALTLMNRPADRGWIRSPDRWEHSWGSRESGKDERGARG